MSWLDKLRASRRSRHEETLRKDREKREERAERRQAKWLMEKGHRYLKRHEQKGKDGKPLGAAEKFQRLEKKGLELQAKVELEGIEAGDGVRVVPSTRVARPTGPGVPQAPASSFSRDAIVREGEAMAIGEVELDEEDAAALVLARQYQEPELEDLGEGRAWILCTYDLEPGLGMVWTCPSCSETRHRRELADDDRDWRRRKGGNCFHACVPMPPRIGEGTSTALSKPTKRDLMTPAERGGFDLTPGEYEAVRMPKYVETDEEAERELEFIHAQEEFQKAVKARDERPGAGVCADAKLLQAGHRWRKVPGQPMYACLECGREANSVHYDLSRGILRRLNIFENDAMRQAGRLLASGQVNELLGLEDGEETGFERVTAGELYNLIESKAHSEEHALVIRKRLGLEMIAHPANPDVVILDRPKQYAEDPEEPGLCMDCGTTKSQHRVEKVYRTVEVVTTDGWTDDAKRVFTFLLCPLMENDDVC